MYYEILIQDEAKAIKELELETGNDYEMSNNYLPISSYKNIIKDLMIIKEDLELEIQELKEEFKRQEEYYQDNYNPKPMSEYTGDLEDDRF